jgi:hypothetical protein
MFEVVKAAGGYTAWSDKHQSYELSKGKSGAGVDDYFAPEINSIPVNLAGILTRGPLKCDVLPDQTAVSNTNAWTDSFANVQCYDAIKVQAILNKIDGFNHDGTKATKLPAVFGMNFQAVSVRQKLNEKKISITGGYKDATGTPSAALLGQIQFVDRSIGAMIAELQAKNLLNATTFIITAKHGQSPIDPKSILRIPADDATKKAPSDIVGAANVAQALEDDVSFLWLNNGSAENVATAVAALEANRATIGADGGEIFYGQSLKTLFADPAVDPRVPNIIVQPKIGVVYTGGTKKLAEHGGFMHDDTNVMLFVSNPSLKAKTLHTPVATMQVAPTVLALLGLNPQALEGVRAEGTEVLPELDYGRSEH